MNPPSELNVNAPRWLSSYPLSSLADDSAQSDGKGGLGAQGACPRPASPGRVGRRLAAKGTHELWELNILVASRLHAAFARNVYHSFKVKWPRQTVRRALKLNS